MNPTIKDEPMIVLETGMDCRKRIFTHEFWVDRAKCAMKRYKE